MSDKIINVTVLFLFICLIIFSIYKVFTDKDKLQNINCYYEKNVVFYNGEFYYKDSTTNKLIKCKK